MADKSSNKIFMVKNGQQKKPKLMGRSAMNKLFPSTGWGVVVVIFIMLLKSTPEIVKTLPDLYKTLPLKVPRAMHHENNNDGR